MKVCNARTALNTICLVGVGSACEREGCFTVMSFMSSTLALSMTLTARPHVGMVSCLEVARAAAVLLTRNLVRNRGVSMAGLLEGLFHNGKVAGAEVIFELILFLNLGGFAKKAADTTRRSSECGNGP